VPKAYFSIPLPNHPALVEAQNFLRRIMPEGTRFVDPAEFHITLLYLEDDKGQDLTDMRVPNDRVALFGASGQYITSFYHDDESAVVLLMQYVPPLIYLQYSLYYEAVARGLTIGASSYPMAYRPHITLAYAPGRQDLFEVMSPIGVEAKAVTLTAEGSFDAVQTWPLLESVPVQEAIAAGKSPAKLMYTLAEAVSGYAVPDIPLPEDFNLEALRSAIGENLIFDTRPIGKATISRNGHKYSQEAVMSLVNQVNKRRPEGRWGHLADYEMGSKYELPAIRWVAAVWDEASQMAWGKCFTYTREARIHLEAANAANAKVGTSIFGINPVYEGNEIIDYTLWTIDLANAEQLGLPDMASVPVPTAETLNTSTSPNTQLVPAKEDVMPEIQEVQAERDRLSTLVESLERQLKEQRPLLEDLQKIATLLNVETDGAYKAVRSQHEQNADLRKENRELLDGFIRNQIADAVKLESQRPVIAMLVAAEKPATRAEATRAVEGVLDRPEIKALLAAAIASEMGPARTRPVVVAPTKVEADSPFIFPSEEKK
jgi:2'-5' RNA ligase